MNKLRIRERWVSIYWGIFGAVLALIFGGIGAYSLFYLHEDSVRMVIPMYSLAVYWVLACAFNFKTTVITPDRVHNMVWPFVVRFPASVRREKIACCFVRHVVQSGEGVVLEVYYSAGIETLSGQQIDISSPHKTREEATHAAHRIAAVLNALPGRPPIKIRDIKQLPGLAPVVRILVLAALWVAIFIAAILYGAASIGV